MIWQILEETQKKKLQSHLVKSGVSNGEHRSGESRVHVDAKVLFEREQF